MERFLASLSNELFKLRKRKKYLVFLIIGAVICVASALRVLIVNYITDGGVSREAILGGLMSSNLPFILLIFLPLMAVMAASDLFVGEQVDHTLRFSLMRPVGKGKLFFSKAAAVFLLCAFDLAVLYVVSTVAQVGLGGGTEGILTSLGACLLDLIPLAVLVLFFCLINQLVRRVQPDGPAVCGFVHRAAGYGDLSARGGGAGVHRVSPVAQSLDWDCPALLLVAAPHWPSGGVRPGLWMLRLSPL